MTAEHEAVSELAAILLREELGISVVRSHAAGMAGAGKVVADAINVIALGIIDADMFTRVRSTSVGYEQHIVEDGAVVDGGPVGPWGIDGWYVPQYLLQKHPAAALEHWTALRVRACMCE